MGCSKSLPVQPPNIRHAEQIDRLNQSVQALKDEFAKNEQHEKLMSEALSETQELSIIQEELAQSMQLLKHELDAFCEQIKTIAIRPEHVEPIEALNQSIQDRIEMFRRSRLREEKFLLTLTHLKNK